MSCPKYRSSETQSQAFGRYFYRHSEVIIGDNAQTMQTPGQRIRGAREIAGFNQGEFAKLVGCSQSTLLKSKQGSRNSRLRRCFRE